MVIYDAHTFFGSVPFESPDLSLQTLLRMMRGHGIRKVLAISLRGAYYDFSEGNEETWLASKTHPEILPVATVDPRKYLGCADEIRRRAEQGFRAFRLFPEIQGWPVNYLPFLELLPEFQAAGLPILIDASAQGTATQLMQALAGRQVPVVLLSVSYDTMGEAVAAAKSSSRVFVETHRLAGPDAFEVLAEQIGIERLVFGSCAPSCCPSSAIDAVAHSGLPESAREKIMGGNLGRLLGINGDI